MKERCAVLALPFILLCSGLRAHCSEAVEWTTLVGVTVSGSTLAKTASTGWGNAGAVSTKLLTSGDGYVEIAANEINTYRLFGLSSGSADATPADIEYAIYLYAGGTAYIQQNGVYLGPSVGYATGDTLRVSVEDGVVKYLRNGVVRSRPALRPPSLR
jgi:hypothetical protein